MNKKLLQILLIAVLMILSNTAWAKKACLHIERHAKNATVLMYATDGEKKCDIRSAYSILPIVDSTGQKLRMNEWLRSVYENNKKSGAMLRGCVPTPSRKPAKWMTEEEKRFCANGIVNYFAVPSSGTWRKPISIPSVQKLSVEQQLREKVALLQLKNATLNGRLTELRRSNTAKEVLKLQQQNAQMQSELLKKASGSVVKTSDNQTLVLDVSIVALIAVLALVVIFWQFNNARQILEQQLQQANNRFFKESKKNQENLGKLDSLRNQNATLHSILEKKESFLLEAKEEADRSQSFISTLQEDLQSSKNTIQNLQQALEDAGELEQELRDELTKESQAVQDLQQALEDTREREQKLRDELNKRTQWDEVLSIEDEGAINRCVALLNDSIDTRDASISSKISLLESLISNMVTDRDSKAKKLALFSVLSERFDLELFAELTSPEFDDTTPSLDTKTFFKDGNPYSWKDPLPLEQSRLLDTLLRKLLSPEKLEKMSPIGFSVILKNLLAEAGKRIKQQGNVLIVDFDKLDFDLIVTAVGFLRFRDEEVSSNIWNLKDMWDYVDKAGDVRTPSGRPLSLSTKWPPPIKEEGGGD